MGDEIKHSEEEVLENIGQRQTEQWQGRIGGHGHDPEAGVVDVVTTADAVHEEHVYAYSRTSEGTQLLWEIDLIGDLSPDDGHGRLPPQLHIECPWCTEAEDRRAMTVLYETRGGAPGFTIEPVPPRVEQIAGMWGRREIVIDRLLSIHRVVTCPYCQTRFTIKGGMIEKVVKD